MGFRTNVLYTELSNEEKAEFETAMVVAANDLKRDWSSKANHEAMQRFLAQVTPPGWTTSLFRVGNTISYAARPNPEPTRNRLR